MLVGEKLKFFDLKICYYSILIPVKPDKIEASNIFILG